MQNQLLHYPSWRNVPAFLKTKSIMRNLHLKPGPARATVHQMLYHKTITLYDIREATPRKPATDKQLAAIKKARAAYEALRTCPTCNHIYTQKLSGKECSRCQEVRLRAARADKARATISSWYENRHNYVILDTETTGLGYYDRVVEIAITDLDGNILFESLVNPGCHIPEESSEIHGIVDNMVIDAPTWDKVWPKVEMLIAGKTILTYNSDFDIRMMQQSSDYHGMTFNCPDNQCIMVHYSQFRQSDR